MEEEERLEFISPVISGFRITIPRQIRDILGIKEGDKIRVQVIKVWHQRE